MLFIRFISDEERKKSCLDVIVINGLSFFLSIFIICKKRGGKAGIRHEDSNELLYFERWVSVTLIPSIRWALSSSSSHPILSSTHYMESMPDLTPSNPAQKTVSPSPVQYIHSFIP